MKKMIFTSAFCFSLAWISFSAKAQCNGGNCYAYGHHKNYSASANEQPKVNKEVKTDKQAKEDKQGDTKSSEQVQDKKDGSASSPQTNNKKYNATEFKTKRYFFKSL